MNKRILDVGSVIALVALVAFGVFAVAGGLGGSDTKAADSAREASCLAGAEDCDDTGGTALGVCAPGVTDCVDTVVGGDGDIAGICLAPEEGGDVDCNDTPVDGGGLDQTCASDQPECVVDGGSGFGSDQPVVVEPGDGSSSPGFSGCGNNPECERKAIGAAFAALERLIEIPSDAIPTTSAKAVNWPNACLGVSTPDVACAEVITPGYIVMLDFGILAYTFHTDLNGNAVLFEGAQ